MLIEEELFPQSLMNELLSKYHIIFTQYYFPIKENKEQITKHEILQKDGTRSDKRKNNNFNNMDIIFIT